MQIGFATLLGDPKDPKTWSGTPTFISRALEEEGAEIHYFGPFSSPGLFSTKVKNKIRRSLGLSGLLPGNSFAAAGACQRSLVKQSRGLDLDILMCPAGSAVIANLEIETPIVYSSDATFALMADYYPTYSNVSAAARKQGEILEARAIERGDLLLYPTHWAADSAIKDYGASRDRIRVIPYGANIDIPPSRETALAAREDGPVKLLFVGVDWERKGGNIVVATSDALNARGIDTEITVIGCIPPETVQRDNMKVFPFLRKSVPEEMRILEDSYVDADFFFLPSRSECYGIVYCEAAAFGLPSIAADTGGVSEIVRNGETGICLSLDAEGPEYADAIERLLVDSKTHQAMRQAARDDYETRLNWSVWAKQTIAETQPLLR